MGSSTDRDEGVLGGAPSAIVVQGEVQAVVIVVVQFEFYCYLVEQVLKGKVIVYFNL